MRAQISVRNLAGAREIVRRIPVAWIREQLAAEIPRERHQLHESPGTSPEVTEPRDIRDVVRRLYLSSEGLPDTLGFEARLVRQDVFDELLSAIAAMDAPTSQFA